MNAMKTSVIAALRTPHGLAWLRWLGMKVPGVQKTDEEVKSELMLSSQGSKLSTSVIFSNSESMLNAALEREELNNRDYWSEAASCHRFFATKKALIKRKFYLEESRPVNVLCGIKR
jgi:hypothetical protein